MREAKTVLDEVPLTLDRADFLLAPEAFVERCARSFAVTEAELTGQQRAALADSIRAGIPRLNVLDAIRSRRLPAESTTGRFRVESFTSEWDRHVRVDLLVRFAPNDDRHFVRQAYMQIMGREPTSIEALEAQTDLRSGRVDRQRLIVALADRSPECRLSPEPKVVSSSGTPALAGATVDTKGRTKLVIMQHVPAVGWITSPDVWYQASSADDGTLELSEGWVITGPKRSLPSGNWRLSIDLVQDEMAEVTVDVVANAGLDVLVRLHLAGPALLAQCFEIKPWHHFVEVRVFKPAQEGELRRMKIRELSLTLQP